MPVPADKKAKYSETIASIIANKKKKGESGSQALQEARPIADDAVLNDQSPTGIVDRFHKKKKKT